VTPADSQIEVDPDSCRATYVHLVGDETGGLHGVVVDESSMAPGSTVSVRPIAPDEDGRPRYVLCIVAPVRHEGIAP